VRTRCQSRLQHGQREDRAAASHGADDQADDEPERDGERRSGTGRQSADGRTRIGRCPVTGGAPIVPAMSRVPLTNNPLNGVTAAV
jgi:hypothetical protein